MRRFIKEHKPAIYGIFFGILFFSLFALSVRACSQGLKEIDNSGGLKGTFERIWLGKPDSLDQQSKEKNNE